MKKALLFLFLSMIIQTLSAQNMGDTILVESYTFDNDSRDIMVEFPDDPNLTYEKIILKYTMRCKDGNISTSTERNLGCGEWDFSNNTYLVDSTDIEILVDQVPSHFITNWAQSLLPFVTTPVYNYYREETQEVVVNNVSSETASVTGGSPGVHDDILTTEELAGKSQFLYTAEELTASGLQRGDIAALSMVLAGDAGEANFLRIKMKNTSLTDMTGAVELDNFTEVYYNSRDLQANQSNRFQFHTPFEWDGGSNVLIEFNFSNHVGRQLQSTISGEMTNGKMGLISSTGSEFLLSGNAYIESNDYKGIGGNTNRTIEAWVKADVIRNGEICSWGRGSAGEKWTFRMISSGEIRVEVEGTGTVSRTKINDGNWHHVACVLDGNNASDIRFFIDGVADTNSTTGSGVINTNNIEGINVRVNRGTNNRYFDGEIDDVRIWDTNLSEETIQNWMRRDLDEDHPNYDNLQLHYEFEGSGNDIIDSSPHARHATLLGRDYRTYFADGDGLFKDFSATNVRPILTLFQGDYDLTTTTTTVERPFARPDKIFVSENSIIPGNDNFAKDDEIVSSSPQEYWVSQEYVFDPVSGFQIETRDLVPEGILEITELDYKRRWPMYNELVSFVTPYGIGLDFGRDGATWYFDMSDYASILKGNKRMLMTLGGQNQEDMDLDFMFIVGTPPRDVIKYEQLWQGTNRIGNANISDILNDVKIAPVQSSIPNNADTYKLSSVITGHGSEGEFSQNGGTINHSIFINGARESQWRITQECSENPIFPQGGTWVFDREGWCPGERSLTTQLDLEDVLSPGDDFEIDYTVSNPPVSTGDYRYHMSHQLVAYGPANHTLDASVTEIIAPNNSAEYTRVGAVCGNPQIRIQNTGSTNLTSLTIRYWLNEAAEPQIFEWSGNLVFMESEVVSIPSTRDLWMDVIDSNNKFHVEIDNPNASSDGYPANNTFTSNINLPAVYDGSIAVRVKTNSRPQENSYQLLDERGNVVGANDLSSINSTTRDEYELETGCYKLVFFDSGGDGLVWWANAAQGVGNASLEDENGQTLIQFQPDFGGKFEYSFTTNFTVSAEEINFLTSLQLYPNPADNYVTLEAEDLADTQLYVTNMTGQRVESVRISTHQNKATLETSSLQSGVYFVTIIKDDLKTTRKFVKN